MRIARRTAHPLRTGPRHRQRRLESRRASPRRSLPRRDLPAAHRYRKEEGAGGNETMKNVLLICRKELNSYFASPVAYFLLAAFGFVFGAVFHSATREMVRIGFQSQMMGQQQPMNVNDWIIRPIMGFASTITLFLLP